MTPVSPSPILTLLFSWGLSLAPKAPLQKVPSLGSFILAELLSCVNLPHPTVIVSAHPHQGILREDFLVTCVPSARPWAAAKVLDSGQRAELCPSRWNSLPLYLTFCC